MAKFKLNVYLLKRGALLQQAVRSDITGVREIDLYTDLPYAARVWVKSEPAHPPRWCKLIKEASDDQLEELTSKSASALIALEMSERVFCVVFGSARHWIQDQRIERRFGMITALNTVADEGLRSIDREEMEAVTRTTRSQISMKSSMDKFGLDVQRDLLRSVTGEPVDKKFASHVTGSDNLIMNVDIDFGRLADKCAEALANFQATRYKERYGWIDNFQRVADPEKISALERRLESDIQDEENQNVFLSAPDIKDTQRPVEFRFPRERKGSQPHPDLMLADLIAVCGRASLTTQWIKSQRIREVDVETDFTEREYLIYDAIVYETFWDQQLYALSRGEWYVIAPDYVAEVNDSLRTIVSHPTLVLPDALSREIEGAYNARVAAQNPAEFALLDEKHVIYGGGRSRIEVCDLLAIDRNFIHVKSKTKSSALSHLFAQGLVSAQQMRNLKFRELAADKCDSAVHTAILLPERFRTEDHTITFAVITRSPGDLRNALPFFSKQSLINAVTELRNIGYTVYLNKIPAIA